MTYRIKLVNPKNAKLVAPEEVINFLEMKTRHQVGYAPYTGAIYKSIITKAGNFSPIFTTLIKSLLKDIYPAKIKIDKRIKEMIKPTLPAEIVDVESEYPYREWQLEALAQTFKYGRGVIDVGTGGGKTMFLAGLCESIHNAYKDYNVIIVVPTTDLIRQTEGDLVGFGVNVSVQSGQREDEIPEKGATVLINQAKLIAPKKKKEYVKLFNTYDVIIMDEVHMYANKSNNSAINKTLTDLSTHRKIGLTGSVPDDVAHRWNIMKLAGPTIFKYKAYELRHDKLIADVMIRCLIFEHGLNPQYFFKTTEELAHEGREWTPTQAFVDEKEYILGHQGRLRIIAKLIEKSDDGNMVVLVDTIESLETYTKYFTEKFPDRNVECIYGDKKGEDRKKILADMEKNSNTILVAMVKIFHVGISVKNIKYLMFILIGKAETAIVQSIGRAVRLHDEIDLAVIYDISDDTRYSTLHFLERQNIYEREKINYVQRKISQRLLCKS